MSQLKEQIEQFQKMANDDPENELGHYRLGNLLLQDGQHDAAVRSFERTLELSPQFSKVYQLMGEAFIKLDRNSDAIQTLKKGFAIADERGDNLPRDEMSRMLVALGEPAPAPQQTDSAAAGDGSDTGFRCVRPGCPAGRHARQLEKPPVSDDIGKQIHEKVCADCWNYWLRDMSVKVINEMRLDLSTERSQEAYDQIMKETLGLE